jgi:hypothetical protein
MHRGSIDLQRIVLKFRIDWNDDDKGSQYKSEFKLKIELKEDWIFFFFWRIWKKQNVIWSKQQKTIFGHQLSDGFQTK